MRLLTIDASVFVSAARPGEAGHPQSIALLDWVQQKGQPVFIPTLLLVEVAAALSRTGSPASLAQQYAQAIARLPKVLLVDLNEELAQQATTLGAQHRLRGADAVYVATAAQFAAELITLDQEQLERSKAVVQAFTPAAFLSTL